MNDKNIAVFFGGCSTEHEVSLQSAQAVFERYRSETDTARLPSALPKKGEWRLFSGSLDQLTDGSWERDPSCVPCLLSSRPHLPGTSASGAGTAPYSALCGLSCPARKKRRGRNYTGLAGTVRNPRCGMRHTGQRARDGQGQGAPAGRSRGSARTKRNGIPARLRSGGNLSGPRMRSVGRCLLSRCVPALPSASAG